MSPLRRRLVLSGLLLATVMASLDSSFVPIAFRDIIEKLDTSTSVVVWVALGYLISATGFMLLSSRFAAWLGADRCFQIGVFIYAAAMTACGYAPDIQTLIALRVIQGAGMALFLPITFSLAAEMYPPEERGKALGIMQAGNALGFVAGPIFAGWLLDAYDWRSLFTTRIPLAALAVLGSFLVKDAHAGARTLKRPAWDLPGATLLTLAIFGLLFGLNRLPVEDNHREWLVWAVTLLGFVALYLFVRRERSTPEPLIDLTLFTESREFKRACIAFTAYFASVPVQLFILPLVLVAAVEMRPWDMGMTLAIIALVTTIMSPIAGKLEQRFGAGKLAALGAALTALGYIALIPTRPSAGQLQFVPAMILLGFGSALFFAPNNSLMMGNVPPRARVTAAGLIGVLRQSGYAAGFAMIASLVTAIQDNVEEVWSAASTLHLRATTAGSLSFLFEEGGIMSPELLMFIMRVGVLLAVAILGVAVANSLPGLRMNKRSVTLMTGMTVAGVIAGVLAVAAASGVPLSFAGAATPVPSVSAPTPFGWAERHVLDQAPVSADGKNLFATNCVTCHGADLKGLPQLGVNLIGSKFVKAMADDAALAKFLEVGRMPGQPGNVTGRVMPGFGYLAAGDRAALANYVRSQQP